MIEGRAIILVLVFSSEMVFHWFITHVIPEEKEKYKWIVFTILLIITALRAIFIMYFVIWIWGPV